MRISISRSIRRRGFSSLLSRFYSSVEADVGGGGFKIFDRDLKRKQRDRAAWLARPKDVLVDTVAANMLDRLQDCKKTFPTALCMGGPLHAVRRLMRGHEHGGIKTMSEDMIRLCKKHDQDDQIEMVYVVGDEEYLPMEESSLDLVISCLGLHWTNDLPGAIIQGAENSMHNSSNGAGRRHQPTNVTFSAGAGFTLPGVDVDECVVRYGSG